MFINKVFVFQVRLAVSNRCEMLVCKKPFLYIFISTVFFYDCSSKSWGYYLTDEHIEFMINEVLRVCFTILNRIMIDYAL